MVSFLGGFPVVKVLAPFLALPSSKRHGCPNHFYNSKRPGALQESIDGTKGARCSER